MTSMFGNLIIKGVSSVQSSRISISEKKSNYLSVTEPANRSHSQPSKETIIPLRNVHSVTLDFPDNSYCSYLATALGFAIGIPAGVSVGAAGGTGTGAVATAAVTGGLSAACSFMLCNSRKAVLTIRTPKEDYSYSVQSEQKEQSIKLFNTIKENI